MLFWVALLAGTIRADAAATIVGFNGEFYATEKEQQALIWVFRNGDLTGTTQVNYRVDDPIATQGTLTFAPGDSLQSFQVSWTDDSLVNGDRTIPCLLTNLTGAPTWSEISYLTIHDDETPNVVDDLFSLHNRLESASPRIYPEVSVLMEQPDGRILVGGAFDRIGQFENKGLARINRDGSVDPSFHASVQPIAGSEEGRWFHRGVMCLALQPDGKILVGGSFDTISGTACKNIARLNTDGSLDTSFTANILGDVLCLTTQLDGKVLAGGVFNTVNGRAKTNIARLNLDGSLDIDFTTFTDSSWIYQPPHSSWDTSEVTNFSTVRVILELEDKIYVGGSFRSINGKAMASFARLRMDGTLDEDFRGADADEMFRFGAGEVSAIKKQANGFLIAGAFGEIQGHLCNGVALVDLNGIFAEPIIPEEMLDRYATFCMASQGDEIFVARGECDFGCGAGLWRLNSDGSVAENLALPQFSMGDTGEPPVQAMLVQPDGSLIIGGRGDGLPYGGLFRRGTDSSKPAITFEPATEEWGGIVPLAGVGDEGSAVSITIERVGESSKAATVTYETSDDSAVAGLNYISASGLLTFAPMETLRSFTVPLLQDRRVQDMLSFDILLRDPGASTLIARGKVSIRNVEFRIPADSTTYSDGMFKVLFGIEQTGDFWLEASTDLTNWTAINRFVISPDSMTVSDTNAVKFTQRFYRMRRAE